MKRILPFIGIKILFLICTYHESDGQETFPRNDVKDLRPGQYAFTNATIVIDHQTTIEKATLLIDRDR